MRHETNTHVVEQVDDYLHGLLDSRESELVQNHCEACPICTVALQEARKRFAAFEALTPREASEALIRQTLQRIGEDESARSRRLSRLTRWGITSGVAAVLVLGAVHLYYLNLKPTPYDLRLLGQRELLAGTSASLRVQLTDRDRNEAVAGVPVEIEIRQPDQPFIRLASFTTDDRGTGQPRLDLPDWKDGNYEFRITARPAGSPEIITRSIKLKRSWKVMLTSDKPVYQPSQMIRLRSLALRQPDLKPVAGQETVYTISDPKGNLIYKQRAVTSPFGITSADCALADEILEGSYTVICKVGDVESRLGLQVKKHVLPKFKTQVRLDHPYYQPGQIMRGKLDAGYFFGKPVAGAVVSIDVAGSTTGMEHLVKLTARTDEKGQAEFTWRVPDRLNGRPQESGDARLSITAAITDSAGQKESTTLESVITAHPLRIELIPEAGKLVKDVANTVYVFTSYADGTPAQTSVNISGRSDTLSTNALGVTSFEMTPKDGESLTVSARDAKSFTTSRSLELSSGKSESDFLVRTDKSVYRGGDTMRLVALGGGSEPVFVDVLKDGQIILTTSIGMSQGRGEYHLDLPPELFGTLELQYYRFGSYGLPTRKSRVIYVESARQVEVHAVLDHAEYRPGQQAKLAVTLTDAAGKPLPGAVSLAAVDEAVFAVLDQRPGLEGTFFTLEQELLKPVYAIYPWSPQIARQFPDKSQQEFERALFSLTAKETTGQAEVFRRMVDEGSLSPRALDVFENDNLDELVERAQVSDQLVGLIHGDSQNVLRANTFPLKTRQVAVRRTAALNTLQTIWILLALGGAAGIMIAIFRYSRSLGLELLVSLGALTLLVSICLPSLSRARSQSKSVALTAALNAVDKSLAMSSSEFYSDFHRKAVPLSKTNERGTARIREWFPETLLWRPQIITDDRGRATIDIDLADSITTWRVTGSAVTADGRLGSLSSAIRVFQPFFVDVNLPVALTRGDEVAVPIVVYNYLDETQTVELTLDRAEWFQLLGDAVQKLELAPNEVRSLSYRIHAAKAGRFQLQVTARGQGPADAIRRDIEVVPEGRLVEQVFNGNLQSPADLSLAVPSDAIEGSVKAILKIYPSTFSQLVEGLDGIFQRPYGCFEQTSSTTYPNVLALEYLRRTNKALPEVEAKARQYIHLGYQRLLGFEISGGGFDWFGQPPANRTLTAYGLMEFEDMARVHDVDWALITRTRRWLLEQRRSDGSWPAEAHAMHDDPTSSGSRTDADLSTTAYIAWAVLSDPAARSDARPTMEWLLAHSADQIASPYVLALLVNALRAMDPAGASARPYIERLSALRHSSDDGKQIWWTQPAAARTSFYGSGVSGNVETTALAVLGMIGTADQAGTIKGALNWLTAQKDARGTWYSTQATVLALKALLAGTGQPLGGETERQIVLTIDDAPARTISIPADQSDVVKQLDLSRDIVFGKHRVQLSERGGAGSIYQLTLRHHDPGAAVRLESGPLAIDVVYDRAELVVADHLNATATVSNQTQTTAPMVILDLPVPAGFAVEAADFDALVRLGQIAKYQVTARSTIVYIRNLSPSAPLVVKYRLMAVLAVEVNVPRVRVYEYYDPTRQAFGNESRLIVRSRT